LETPSGPRVGRDELVALAVSYARGTEGGPLWSAVHSAVRRTGQREDLVAALHAWGKAARNVRNAAQLVALWVDEGVDALQVLDAVDAARLSEFRSAVLAELASSSDPMLRWWSLGRAGVFGLEPPDEAVALEFADEADARLVAFSGVLRDPLAGRGVSRTGDLLAELRVAWEAQDGPALLGVAGRMALARTHLSAVEALQEWGTPSEFYDVVMHGLVDPERPISGRNLLLSRRLRDCLTPVATPRVLLASHALLAPRLRWWEYLDVRRVESMGGRDIADALLFAIEGWSLWAPVGSCLASQGLEDEVRGVFEVRGETFPVTGRVRCARVEGRFAVRFSGWGDIPYGALSGPGVVRLDAPFANFGVLRPRATAPGRPSEIAAAAFV